MNTSKLGKVCALCAASAMSVMAADVTMSPGGEVRSIAAALEKVRALRAAGAIPDGRVAEVSVSPGRYPVAEVATFTPVDRLKQLTAFADSLPPEVRSYTSLGIAPYDTLTRRKIYLGTMKTPKFPDQFYVPVNRGIKSSFMTLNHAPAVTTPTIPWRTSWDAAVENKSTD